VTKAGLATFMSSTWVQLGHKNALDTMSNLVKISQRVAFATTSGSLPELLCKIRFILAYLYVRMVAGSLDRKIATRPLLVRAPDGAQADRSHKVKLPIQQEHRERPLGEALVAD
jgi:hypothetical protein